MYINKKILLSERGQEDFLPSLLYPILFFFSIYLTSKANTAGKILGVVSLEPQLGV